MARPTSTMPIRIISATGMIRANSTATDPFRHLMNLNRRVGRCWSMASLNAHERLRLQGRRIGDARIVEQRIMLLRGVDAYEGAPRAVGTGFVAFGRRSAWALAHLPRCHGDRGMVDGQGTHHHLLDGGGVGAVVHGILDARAH